MAIPLLSTKFNIPIAGRSLVHRQRLIDLLNDGVKHSIPIIVVSAPAGYGKSTVVSDWINHSTIIDKNCVAWLTLEKNDNYFVRFVTYFISAIQQSIPEFGNEILNSIQTHKTQSPEILATILINSINDLTQRIYLVLDDYHLISAKPIQIFMSFMIEHLPPNLRLLFLSRSDPHFSLIRFRTYGQLIEIRQNHLAFTLDETEELLNQSLYPPLNQDEIFNLNKFTEGWVSGLHLAGITLREVQDRSEFFNTFSGEHEFIAAFLLDEVFNKLDERVKNFLLKTSILNHFTLPLSQFVTQEEESKAILEELIENNLFIVSMDKQNNWYRYHTLFAELLKKQLSLQPPDLISSLHLRAANWYQSNDMTFEAISHSLAAYDYESAIQNIENISESWLMKGDSPIILHWLELIPKDIILSHPNTSIILGISLFLNGRKPEIISSLIDEIKPSFEKNQIQGELSLLQALLGILKNDPINSIHFSKEALAYLHPEYSFYRSLAADALGMGYTLIGDYPAAIKAFEDCLEYSKQTDNITMKLLGLTNLSGLHYIRGELRKAVEMCYQVLELAKSSIGINNPLLGKTFFNLGEMLREQGELKQSLHYLETAAQLMETFSEFGLPLAYLAIARLKLNLKEWDLVQSHIDQARNSAKTGPSPQITERIIDIMQARLWLARENYSQVLNWLQAKGLLDKPIDIRIQQAELMGSLSEFFITENQILIRYYLNQNKPEKTIEIISPLLEYLQKKDNKRRVIELLVLKAIALNQQNKPSQSLEVLQEAFSLAEPEGFQRVFIDEGNSITNLLNVAISNKIYPHFSGKLLSIIVREQQPTISKIRDSSEHIIEPLSDREIEVLSLISKGFSNPEIANRLFISLSTVKGHTTNIYGKLGVKNRTQAVSLARNVGIITEE